MNDNSTINNHHLLEELNRTNRELAVLYEVSNAMRTTLELNHVLYIILTGVTSHTGLGFNRAVLFLPNASDRTLEPKIAIGPESGEDAKKIWDYISGSNQHLNDLIKEDKINQSVNQGSLFNSIKDLKIPYENHGPSLLAMAYQSGNAAHIKPNDIHFYHMDPLLQKFKTKELVIMPLKAKDKVNGLIIADNLYTQKPITGHDMRIFTMLANQAGLAIENSQLYELVKIKSHTDSITNLWNHGFFQIQLTKELERAKPYNIPVGLIMLDIDNFKKLNDTYGHQNGDIVLKEIAKITKKSSRETDYVCRYGGEEFAIILPQTNKESVFTIAERIRQNVEKNIFTQFSNQETRITVSLGMACFPEDATSKEDLIGKADKAMYIAKFSGKNQTCLASQS